MALNEAIKDRINKLFDKYIGCDSEETRNQPSRTGHIHLTSITLMVLGMLIGFLVKKALHSNRMSKWKQKMASYISRRQVRIHDAEMVVTLDQFDTLKATIEHGCVVSGKQINEALERYKHLPFNILDHYDRLRLIKTNQGEQPSPKK